MKIEEIENVELSFLELRDYEELIRVMRSSYHTMPQMVWMESHIKSLIQKFPEGQVVVKVNGQIAGCALSIIVASFKTAIAEA